MSSSRRWYEQLTVQDLLLSGSVTSRMFLIGVMSVPQFVQSVLLETYGTSVTLSGCRAPSGEGRIVGQFVADVYQEDG